MKKLTRDDLMFILRSAYHSQIIGNLEYDIEQLEKDPAHKGYNRDIIKDLKSRYVCILSVKALKRELEIQRSSLPLADTPEREDLLGKYMFHNRIGIADIVNNAKCIVSHVPDTESNIRKVAKVIGVDIRDVQL